MEDQEGLEVDLLLSLTKQPSREVHLDIAILYILRLTYRFGGAS